MELNFPVADDFVTMCDVYEKQTSCFVVNPEVQKMKDIVSQELKMAEIDYDTRTATLKIHKILLDNGSLYKRRIRFYMTDMSKHRECHYRIKNIVSVVAESNGYEVVYYKMDCYNKINEVCCLVPRSEFKNDYNYENAKHFTFYKTY